jgi:hypothetical protein
MHRLFLFLKDHLADKRKYQRFCPSTASSENEADSRSHAHITPMYRVINSPTPWE